MGRPKKELKKIHAGKVKKAKASAARCLKEETSFDKLNRLAKRFVRKGKKKKASAS